MKFSYSNVEENDRMVRRGSPPRRTTERMRVLSPSEEGVLCRRLVDCKRELQSLLLQTPVGVQKLERALESIQPTVVQQALPSNLRSMHVRARALWQSLEDQTHLDEKAPAMDLKLEQLRGEVEHLWAQANLPEDVQESLVLAGLAADCRSIADQGAAAVALPDAAVRYLHGRLRCTGHELEALKNHLIAANQGLVRFIVKRYAGLGLSLADLMQEGNIGLMRAVDKFDVERGVRFNTYAVWWVRQAARRALANQSRTIRVPVHASDARAAVTRAQTRLAQELGREASAEDLERDLGLGTNAIERALNLVKEPLSLEAPRGADGDYRLLDSLVDTTQPRSDANVWANQRKARLEGLLSELTPREAHMMRMRFGLVEGEDEATLEEIGQAFGLTRERARQIVDAGLGKLRRAAARQGIDLS